MTFKLSVTFPEFDQFDAKPLSVLFKNSEYMHDALELTLTGNPVTFTSSFVSGTPIQVAWGPSGTFYGYVDRVLPKGVNIPKSQVKLSCVGTTYPMKQSDFRIYQDASISTAIKEICEQFGLASLVEESTMKWPSLSQGGDSAWKFVVDMCKKVGYTLLPSDSSIIAFDRRKAIAGSKHFFYKFSPKAHSYYDDIGDHTEALRFEPKASTGEGAVASTPGRWAVNVVSRYSGETFRYSLPPEDGQTMLFERMLTGKAPTTLEEADSLLRAANSLNNFSQRAKLTVRLNPKIRAGSVIDLNLFDQNEMFKGKWFVTNVEHSVVSFDRTVSLTNIDMIRDPSLDEKTSDTIKWARQPLPPTTYRNNRWEAAWSTNQ